MTEESYAEKLRLLQEAQHIPLERWKAQTVLAWLEITLGMPQYGAMCGENIRSGKVKLSLTLYLQLITRFELKVRNFEIIIPFTGIART